MGNETSCVPAEMLPEPIELPDDFALDPHASYDRLHALGPVHHVRFPDSSTGWLITGYEAAKAAFLDPAISKVLKSPGAKAAMAASDPGQQLRNGMFADMLVFYDPPEHTRLRALVNRAFAGSAVRDLAPRIAEIADSLLAEMAHDADASQDLLDRFAAPLSIRVISELLGVPHEDHDRFRTWSTIVVSGEYSGDTRTATVSEFVTYIDGLIRAKTDTPGADLLSELITVSEDGDRLTHRELISMVFVLLVAGFESSANLIGNAVATLLANSDSRQLLRRDPDRIGDFVEEVLRYRSPTREATFRYTTAPVVLGGVEIPAGQRIVVSMAAAGRDPHRFSEPDRVDIDRPDNKHLSFGHGIHRCVGAPLGRMEATIALTRLLGEYPDLELADNVELEWRKSLIVRGLTTLPVRLRP